MSAAAVDCDNGISIAGGVERGDRGLGEVAAIAVLILFACSTPAAASPATGDTNLGYTMRAGDRMLQD
jgi:hypothetical protein